MPSLCLSATSSMKKPSAADRPELELRLRALRPGDTLVVWRIDRLGRSLNDAIRLLGQLEQHASFKSLSEKSAPRAQQDVCVRTPRDSVRSCPSAARPGALPPADGSRRSELRFAPSHSYLGSPLPIEGLTFLINLRAIPYDADLRCVTVGPTLAFPLSDRSHFEFGT